jgi:hypothetical protein
MIKFSLERFYKKIYALFYGIVGEEVSGRVA